MATGVNATPYDPWYGAVGEIGLTMQNAIAITPSDAAPLPFVTRQIRVVGGGNLNVMFEKATAAITIAVSAGETLNWRVKQVFATGTTATAIAFQ
jgi:hypothetical protein